ncbi:hypothetical protein BDF22DRAFT_656267 [Syncephalis plumigaleata]|nr:hypothetical protein BDF22DRAFT_656267 [Syncephalis plumigaleata]
MHNIIISIIYHLDDDNNKKKKQRQLPLVVVVIINTTYRKMITHTSANSNNQNIPRYLVRFIFNAVHSHCINSSDFTLYWRVHIVIIIIIIITSTISLSDLRAS